MRRSVLVMTLVAAWAAIPSSDAVVATASLAAASLLVAGEAHAGTALLPGWKHSCGRDPRCFERGEHRRQIARLRAPSAHAE